jgi:Delta7-sterol 5-desaturase
MDLLRDVAVGYALLVTTYFAVGLWLSRATARGAMAARRIRALRRPRPEDVGRDIRRSLVNLGVLAVFLAGARALQRAGIGFAPPALSVGSAALMLVGSALVFDAWFYWVHRLLHTRWLFRRLHRLHHQSVHPTAWSNNNDAFLDSAVSHLYWLIAPLLLPIHPAVLVAHKLLDQVGGGFGHCGHETPGRIAPWWPLTTVTHHDQHHGLFDANFGVHFVFWDRWMGTESPTYRSTLAAITGSSAPNVVAAAGGESVADHR